MIHKKALLSILFVTSSLVAKTALVVDPELLYQRTAGGTYIECATTLLNIVSKLPKSKVAKAVPSVIYNVNTIKKLMKKYPGQISVELLAQENNALGELLRSQSESGKTGAELVIELYVNAAQPRNPELSTLLAEAQKQGYHIVYVTNQTHETLTAINDQGALNPKLEDAEAVSATRLASKEINALSEWFKAIPACRVKELSKPVFTKNSAEYFKIAGALIGSSKDKIFVLNKKDKGFDERNTAILAHQTGLSTEAIKTIHIKSETDVVELRKALGLSAKDTE